MKKFIKSDLGLGFSTVLDTEQEVIEGCGYSVDEITFEDLLRVKGFEDVYEIIEIEGDFTIYYR